MSESRRITYIDVAKGIGMLMVVIGHTYEAPLYLNRAIFSVHMPLFFILAGFFCTSIGTGTFGSFLKKTAKSLLVPYALTCGLIFISKIIMNLASGRSLFFELKQWILTFLYGSGARIPDAWEKQVYAIGVIWFLLALFFGKVLLRLILHSRVPWLWAAMLFFASYISTDLFWLPLSLQPAFCSVLFLYIGYAIRKNDQFEASKITPWLWIAATAIWVYCIIKCGVIWMVQNYYEYGILSIIGSVCATYSIIGISHLIDRYLRRLGRMLCFVGQISLGIMCAHMLVLQCWPRWEIMDRFTLLTGWPQWVCDMLDILVITAVVTLILYYIPWLSGRFFPQKSKRR